EYKVRAKDRNADALSFRLVTSPTGMTIDSATGRITWTPSLAQTGAQNVAIEVKDSYGALATQSYSVIVIANAANSAPVLLNRPGFVGSVGIEFAFDADAVDADGDPIRFSLAVAPDGMAVDSVNGRVRWVPTRALVGQQTFIIVLDDGQGGGSPYAFT